MTSDEAPLRRGGGMKYASLALPRRRLLLPVLALGGLLLAGCATVGPKEHYKRGKELFNHDKFAAAEKEFREVIRQTPDSVLQMPDSAWVYHWLGWSIEKQRRYDDAAQVYREVIRLQPNWSGGYSRLGGMLILQGKLAEAEKALREAVRLNPGDYIDLETLGFILDKEGKRGEARIYWLKALEVDPDKEWIKKRLAEPD